ncbi:crosslink repair DNA glycosylase YcaQ family protein [Dactylosporangium sp. NPDC051484]|uniref:winged helix-turn-helix domain-containing protein n=1 Tax=Dactylosporangium sp. NPDC051484 TaxID=3154942 RepID=UPI00344C53B4
MGNDRFAGASLPSLSASEATRLAVRAQGFAGLTDATSMLDAVGAVQLDTIAVLARSHELVGYARLGPVGRASVEHAYWRTGRAGAFEYPAHAACLLPAAAWPYFAFRRREKLAKTSAQLQADPVLAEVRARLADGPVTVTDLGGAKGGPGWFNPSRVKVLAEWLWGTGEAVCTQRQGFKRVYDLPHRVLPGQVLRADPDDDACHDYLVHAAVRAMGVATRHDIADYYWLRLRAVDRALQRSDLVAVRVEGWDDVAWTQAASLEQAAPPCPRTTLLSPFDSLIWTRDRMRRLFGVVVLLEAYRPKHERVNGYFAMPVLSGERIIGRVDPAREGNTLVLHQVALEPPAGAQQVGRLAEAVQEAAQWVGCTAVAVGRAEPAQLARQLTRALG